MTGADLSALAKPPNSPEPGFWHHYPWSCDYVCSHQDIKPKYNFSSFSYLLLTPTAICLTLMSFPSSSSMIQSDSDDSYIPPDSDQSSNRSGTPPGMRAASSTHLAASIRSSLRRFYGRVYGQLEPLCPLTLSGWYLEVSHCVPKATKAHEVSRNSLSNSLNATSHIFQGYTVWILPWTCL